MFMGRINISTFYDSSAFCKMFRIFVESAKNWNKRVLGRLLSITLLLLKIEYFTFDGRCAARGDIQVNQPPPSATRRDVLHNF